MSRAKKDFSGPLRAPVVPIPTHRARARPARILFPVGVSPRTADFGCHYGRGIDQVVDAFQQSVEGMLVAGLPSPATLATMCKSSGPLDSFLSYCAEQSAYQGFDMTLDRINRSVVAGFIGWLSCRITKGKPSRSLSYCTQRGRYTGTKTVLTDLVERDLISNPDGELFPFNPYPSSNSRVHRVILVRSLSDRERDQVIAALFKEVQRITSRTDHILSPKDLAICFFAIALKTGRNTTPLLEVSRTPSRAFEDHPLHHNRKFLITYKSRTGRHTRVPITTDRESQSVGLDVFRLHAFLREATERLVTTSPEEFKDRLWLYQGIASKHEPVPPIRMLQAITLYTEARSLMQDHGLTRDDGTPLQMSARLFRKTLGNDVWRRGNRSIRTVAHALGNTLQVADKHYLEPTPQMERDHSIAVESMVGSLQTIGNRIGELTPVGRCLDPLNGERAPHNGQPCMDFVSCFRCKSQVITGDDMHRLFSFYWLALREREHIGSEKWRAVFSWVVRAIDRDITPKLERALKDSRTVADAKSRARVDPHPFWRSRDALASLGSVA